MRVFFLFLLFFFFFIIYLFFNFFFLRTVSTFSRDIFTGNLLFDFAIFAFIIIRRNSG